MLNYLIHGQLIASVDKAILNSNSKHRELLDYGNITLLFKIAAMLCDTQKMYLNMLKKYRL